MPKTLMRIAIGVLVIISLALAFGIIWGGPRYIPVVGAFIFLAWVVGGIWFVVVGGEGS